MGEVHSQPGGGDAVGRLVRSGLRYKGLIVAVVLVGLLGYGWAARQPTIYEGVSGFAWLTVALSTRPASSLTIKSSS